MRAVRVEDDLWQRARALAAEEGDTVSRIVRAALEDYVRHREAELAGIGCACLQLDPGFTWHAPECPAARR